MSIYCDKIVGYGLDIKNEWDLIDDDTRDRWLTNDYENIVFKAFDSAKNSTEYLTIVDDGLSGEYTKLVYVTAIERNSYEEENSIDKGINELLYTSEVPFGVKQKVKAAYREIFGKELNRTSLIKAMYLVHWH